MRLWKLGHALKKALTIIAKEQKQPVETVAAESGAQILAIFKFKGSPRLGLG